MHQSFQTDVYGSCRPYCYTSSAAKLHISFDTTKRFRLFFGYISKKLYFCRSILKQIKMMSKANNLKRMMSNRDIAIVVIAALLMTVAAFIQYFYLRHSLISAATQSAKSDLSISCQQIETEVTEIETAVNTMSYSVLQNQLQPESMYDITYRVLKNSPVIQSCVIAFSKGYYSPQKDSLFAPSSYREGNGFNRRLVIDYLQEPWYQDPATYRKPQWSEPYVLKGSNHEMYVTYSYPITDPQGKLVAVLAANVPVDSLTKVIDGVEGYPNSYAVLTSKSGHRLVGTNEDIDQDDALVFSSEIGKVGWNLTTVCPNEDINKKTETTRIIAFIMQALALLLLSIIVIKSLMGLRRLQTTAKEKQRMGEELEEAGDVQDAMQSTEAEDLPRNNQVETFAKVLTAREIGGDFYDCFIDEGQLFFCIGDVAGKGAPAALLMAMAKSAFRVSAQHHESPAQIITEVNQLICKMNDGKTTVKMLGGTLDLATGDLLFCNAGMHSPKLLTAVENSDIAVVSNDRIGIHADTTFQEQQTTLAKQSTLFLYTDGLTEAVNERLQQWGMKHLDTQLSSSLRMNPDHLLNNIEKAITNYTEGASLPDDITLLAIKYIG